MEDLAMEKRGQNQIDSPTFNIILADDHAMFRRAIRKILKSISHMEVVGEASDGIELLELLKKTSPQMILLDISMPNLRGLEAIREIKLVNSDIKVLILTMHQDKEYLYYALSAGAEGYLLKKDSESELLKAIDTLKNGGTYTSPLLSDQLADLFIWKSQPTTNQPENPKEHLTNRERQVIKLIAEGKSNQEIGDLLFISGRTVEHHRTNIMKKLNFKKTADLVRYAIYNDYTTSST